MMSLCIPFFFTLSCLNAQVNIIDPNATNAPDVEKCYGETTLQALLQFIANGPSATVNLPMPTGVSYVPGSLMLVSQTGGLGITETDASSTTPTFTITGPIISGREIRFSFRVKASCSAIAGTDIFPLNTTFNGNTIDGELLADIIMVDLNLLSHNIQSASIGAPVTVPIRIQNGGLGQTDNITFSITETGMSTSAVSVGGFPAMLVSTSGNTKTYQLPVAGLPGGTLNNPESITVLRTVTITSCTFSSSYSASWGCEMTNCQTPVTGPGEFILNQGSPNLQMSSSIISPISTCSNAVIDITFTNNGTGSANAAAAFNSIFKFGLNGLNTWSSSNWSVAVGGITLNGNPVIYSGGTSGTPVQINGSQFSSAMPGGMSDLDLDGQFDDLPSGNSLTFRVTLQYSCPVSCPAPNDQANLVAGAMYNDQCGGMLSGSVNTGFNFTNNGGGSEVFRPATVSDGEKFNVTICVQRNFSGATCPTNAYALHLNLPPNVMATGLGSINGSPASVSTSFGVATLSGGYSSFTTCFTLELMYACGGGPMNFSYEAVFDCDNGCCVQKWGCGNFSILGRICDVCTQGGITVSASSAKRVTLGYTDRTGSATVNPAGIPASNLRKGMPCDEFVFTFEGSMNGGTGGTASFDNGYLEFSYDQLAGGNLLQYLSAGSIFSYYNASSGVTTNNIPLPAPTDTVIGGRHVLIFNFNSFIQSLPEGIVSADDSISVLPRFRVLSNNGLTVVSTQPGNAYAAFFNLASASGNPLPGGDARITCDYSVPEFYLHNVALVQQSVAGERNGCGSYQVSGALQHQLTILADEYPGEIRPLIRLNSISVQIQNGDTYDPGVTPALMVFGSADDPWYTGTFNLPAPSISGNTLTWTNPGNWPLHDLAGANQANTGYQLKFNLINSGCVNAVDGNLQTTWNYNRSAYGPLACQTTTSSGAITGVVAAGAPAHTLTNLTGTINATKQIECFQVRINNTTPGRESRYVWLAMEDNLSTMKVVSVSDVTGAPVTLPLVSYSNGKWVRVTNTLPGGSSRTLEICVTYNGCTSNNLVILQGWDCPAYPSNPATTTCPTQTLSANLNIIPRPAAIQGNFLATSSLPATMCNDFGFNVLISSTQQGDIINPRVKVVLPAGVTLQGNVRIEYPLNSGNIQNASPIINGQEITVLLDDHSQVINSLPGTINADPVTYPGGEDRLAMVFFSIRTSCSFFSGDYITYQPFANATCSATAIGSGSLFRSPRIKIQGAEPTYEGTFSFNVEGGSTIVGCTSRRVAVNVQLADLLPDDGLAASTGGADTIYLSLPNVVDYVPGSFVCSTLPTGNCPIFVDQTIGTGGRRILKFVLPPNISIPSGGLVNLAFNFRIQPQQNISCTVNDQITANILAVYNNIYCQTTDSNCPAVIALAGEGEVDITLRKTQLVIESFNLACNSIGNLQYTSTIRIQNSPLLSGESIVVEYYCLNALGQTTTLVETRTITGPLAAGTLVTQTGSFAGCDPQNGVLMSIPLTTATNSFQCHCGPVSRTSTAAPKCPGVTVTVADNDICSYQTVTATATLSGAATGGTWTRVGSGTAGSFNTNTSLTTTYTPSSADVTAGQVVLRFTTNDPTGTCTPAVADITVIIRPRPIVAASTLTVCANASGGNTGTFNLAMANELVDPLDINSVTYHSTQANANNGSSPLTSPYSATHNTVVYARVFNPITGCYTTTTLTLLVNAVPAASNTSLSVCEQDTPNQGLGVFNLTQANNNVNSGTGITITYHATLAQAQAGTSALPGVFTSASTTIYARVLNNSSGCFNTSTITLTVLLRPVAYAGQLERCPNVFDGNLATFTLSNANVQVTGGVSGLTVTYYQSLTEAEQGINALPNVYTAQTRDVWVRVSNAAGCFDVDQVQLVVLENPEILATATDVSCFGGTNGSAMVEVLGGALPYTFDWSNNGSDNPDNDPQAITGLSAGVYTVTVTDGNGCMSEDNVIVRQPTAALSAVVNNVTPVACFGAATGAIQLTVSGGTAPYSYNWPGALADVEDPDNVAAGTYTVTVTDLKGCSANATAIITQPSSALMLSTTVTSNALCSGGNTGAASVNASGGTPGYTYLWSNGQTTPAANNLSAGAYTVTVTDAAGCSKVATAVITNPAGLAVNISSFTNVSCQGGSNGSATVMAAGGTPPYAFAWSNGASGQTVNNLPAGTYVIVVTDANGCMSQTSVTITQPALLSATLISKQDITCNGANNGGATLLATGGTAPFTFTWPGAFVENPRTGLNPGTYAVTVTDQEGCMATVAVQINEPLVLSATVSSQNNVSCYGGNNGSINLTVNGGTAPYDYEWSGAAQDVQDPQNLVAGIYTVTVTDANGCTAITSTTIAQPTNPLNAGISSFTNAACNGSATGSATVSATGGTPNYTYLWNNGQNTSMATNLSAGVYQVTVTDMNGCTAVTSVTIINPALLEVNITALSNVSCNGLANGSASVMASGGSPTYTYAWRTLANVPVGAGNTQLNLAPGTYVVEVTDANNCTAQTTVTITEPPLLIVNIAATTSASCYGGNTGTATAIATGGNPSYTYAWPGGSTGQVLNNLSAGSYTVTVTDETGCQATATALITEPAAPLLITLDQIVPVSCHGGANGAIFITLAGGTAPYRYNWSGSVPNVEDPSGLTAGSYSVVVTDLNGCTATATYVVTEPATAPNVNITNVIDADCSGNGTGQATAVPVGGSPGYSYLWSNGQTSATATNLSAGAYQVTVTDANGCTAVGFVVIENPANLLVSITAQTNVLCNGESTGGAVAQASGGKAPYTFAWSNNTFGPNLNGVAAGQYFITVTDDNGCMVQASVNITEPTLLIGSVQNTSAPSCFGFSDGAAVISATGGAGPYVFTWSDNGTGANRTNLTPGNYSVTVTDANKCSTAAMLTIPNAPSALVLNVGSVVNVSCFGGNDGGIPVSVSGGTAPYQYSWSNGAPNIEDPFGLPAGTYNLTVTDSKGCTATTTVVVSQPAAPVVANINAFIHPLCNGNANGSATVTPSGGVGSYTYLWSNGQTTATAINLAAADYTVTVTDANGCSAEAFVTLVNPPVLNVFIASKMRYNVTVRLRAVLPPVSGGTASYTYLWSNGQNTATAAGLTAGFYFVTVTDQNGCQAFTSVQITQPPLVVASIISTTPANCTGDMNGTALASAAGGLTPYTFTWPGGVTGALRTGLAAGSYVVTVTDANGCTATATAVVGQPSNPVGIAVTNVTNILCYGAATGAIDITVSGGVAPYLYTWTNPAADVEDPTGLPAGIYTVVVVDANGCSATQTVSITQPATPVSATAIVVNNALCSGTGTGEAMAVPSNGTPGYTYAWSNGQLTQNATGLVAGGYQVTVTDLNGCSTVAAVFISNPTNLTAIISSQSPVSCHGGTDGSATVTPNGGTPPYSYLWSGGQTTQTVTNLSEGTHTVTVTDAAGCIVVVPVYLPAPPLLLLNVLTTQPVSCAGATNGIGSVFATGGTPGYIYTWPGNRTGAKQTGLAAGSYVVTVTDANNCTTTTTVTIGSNGQLDIDLIQNIGPACPGSSIPAIVLSASPFDPNILYSWSGGALAGLADGSSTGLNPQIAAFTPGSTEGVYTVTVTATLQTCTATRTFDIAIRDDQAPQFQDCPGMVMVGNDPDLCGAKVNWTPLFAVDNCGGTVLITQTQGLPSGSIFPVGSTTIEYTATDQNGNASICRFVVVVVDAQRPHITCPASEVYRAMNEACSFRQTSTEWDAKASDNCTIESLTHNYAGAPSNVSLAGAVFPAGSTTVVWTAIDPYGNMTTCSFTVNVSDKTAPNVTAGTCPSNIEVNNDDGICGAVVHFVPPTFEDNCDGQQLSGVRTGLAPGSVFPIGTSTVRYTYIDAAGNAPAVCEFTVTVRDNQQPRITCPTDIVVGTNGVVSSGLATITDVGACGVTLAYSMPLASDNCPNWNLRLLSGTGPDANFYAYNGTYLQRWEVRDAAGNTATCQFSIRVEDLVPPTITCPADVTVYTDPDQCTAQVTYALPIPLDNCSGYTVNRVQGPASGASFGIGRTTVQYEIIDHAGNTAYCSFVVTVLDRQTPKFITCLPDMILTCDAVPPTAANTAEQFIARGGMVTDNCTNTDALLLSSSDSDNGKTICPDDGMRMVTRTYVLTDAAGNQATCTQRFMWEEDRSAPIVTTLPDTLVVECDGMGNTAQLNAWLASHAGGVAEDNSGCSPQNTLIWSHRLEYTDFLCGNQKTYHYTFTVRDTCGNAVSHPALFVIQDTQPPVIVRPARDTVVSCKNGSLASGDFINWLNNHGGAEVQEVCSQVTWTHNFVFDMANMSCFGDTVRVIFTATTPCGVSVKDTALVIIQGLDFGDLPDVADNGRYPTTLKHNGARHIVAPLGSGQNVFLGNTVDVELDGSPSIGASGDGVDEDGIAFLTPLMPGQQARVRISASNQLAIPATVYAFADFDGNGVLDPLVFNTLPVVAPGGSINNEYIFNVPNTGFGNLASVYFRFRISTDPIANSPTGLAPNGEVEDYRLSYYSVGNLVWEDRNWNGLQDNDEKGLGINGVVVALVYAGPDGIMETNLNTLPPSGGIPAGDDIIYYDVTKTYTRADGSTTNGLYYFNGLTAGKYDIVFFDPKDGTVTRPNNVTQSLDEDKDSDALPLATLPGLPVRTSSHTGTFTLIGDLATKEAGIGDQDLAQIPNNNDLPISGAPGLFFPDHLVDQRFDAGIVFLDFGDLPNADSLAGANYPTLLNAKGPRHIVKPNFYLGSCADAEIDGAPDEHAGAKGYGEDDGDDEKDSDPNSWKQGAACTDDEDGIRFLTPLMPGYEACIELRYALPDNFDGPDGFLNAWIDYNGNGTLDANEKLAWTKVNGAAASIEATTGALELERIFMTNGGGKVIVCFDVPKDAAYFTGNVLSRFRLSEDPRLGPDGILPAQAGYVDGRIPCGEVEDYFMKLTKVGNLVWEDRNYNGIQDTLNGMPIEQVIPNVPVKLEFAGLDGVFGSANKAADLEFTYHDTTDINGRYYFCGLIGDVTYDPSGVAVANYRMTAEDPDDMTPTVDRTDVDERRDSDGDDTTIDDLITRITFAITNPMAQPMGELHPTGINDQGGVGTFPDMQVNETFDFGYTGFDYGDLPVAGTNYLTLRDSMSAQFSGVFGPRHAIQPKLYLGEGVDGELNGQPDADAGSKNGGDDDGASAFRKGTGTDDESGIRLLTPLIPGEIAMIKGDVHLPGYCSGWRICE
ncbi:MAG: HYR domain-containing protein [Haliscomenobacter sp.]|nr:HYR domain-containing protein [Haliscomenobacter sp.]